MNYNELDVWLNSRELVTLIYQSTKSFPRDELYGLTNQIRRSAISIPSNIVEGCGRHTFHLEYITKKELDILLEKITTGKKLLNGFINYFKNK